MAEEKRNRHSPQKQGNPSDSGKDKSSVKTTGSEAQMLEEYRVNREHLDEKERVPGHIKQNPNRNTDKPDLNKGKYK